MLQKFGNFNILMTSAEFFLSKLDLEYYKRYLGQVSGRHYEWLPDNV